MLHNKQSNNSESTDDLAIYLNNPTKKYSKSEYDTSKKSTKKIALIIILIIDIIVMILNITKYYSHPMIITETIIVASFGLLYGAYRLCAAKKRKTSAFFKKFEEVTSNLVGIILLIINAAFYIFVLCCSFIFKFITPVEVYFGFVLWTVFFGIFDIYSYPFVVAFYNNKITRIAIKIKLLGIITNAIVCLFTFPTELFFIPFGIAYFLVGVIP